MFQFHVDSIKKKINKYIYKNKNNRMTLFQQRQKKLTIAIHKSNSIS